MSRGLTSGMQTVVAAGVAEPILFGYFDFYGGAVRLCTDNKDVTWDGHTWRGFGELIGVQPVEESKELRANKMAFSLNGIPSTLIAELLAYRCRGRACKLWVGGYSSGSVVADPLLLFSGRMGQPRIIDHGEKSDITVTAESRLADLQRPRERRYTDEDQKYHYPGDRGFEFVAQLQNKEIAWGQSNSTTNPSAGGGQGGGGTVEQLL